MSNKISIRNVEVEWLSSRSLMQISRYVVALHEEENTVLNLRDADVLQKVIEHARETDSPRLRSIYEGIKKEIKFCLAKSSVAEQVAAKSIPTFGLRQTQTLGC